MLCSTGSWFEPSISQSIAVTFLEVVSSLNQLFVCKCTKAMFSVILLSKVVMIKRICEYLC